MNSVIYPGSFDPITNGHLDLIERASKIFDKVYVATAMNDEKKPLFSTNERVELLKEVCAHLDNIEVINFDGLLVDIVSRLDVSAVLRGLRAVTDFEFELQMALMNRQLNKKCETIFMAPSPQYSFVSSTIIKEIARHDGDISKYAPAKVLSALNDKKKEGRL